MKTELTIEEIKAKMLAYKDFHGGEFLHHADIESAETKKELKSIIHSHEGFLEAMLSDAISHLNRFEQSLGLGYDD